MKAIDVMNKLFEYGADFHYETTCDTLKIGSPDAEVKKVAVAMFPTVDLIKQVIDWGADLFIVHEPIYFSHYDNLTPDKIVRAKYKLLSDAGITVYRFHDHPHRNSQDLIAAGELKYLGLNGEVDYNTGVFDLVRIKLDEPITAVELAKRIESNLGIKHVRICGARDIPGKKIATCFGAPGDVYDVIADDRTEILLIGEVCEWYYGEYVRDSAALGLNKSLLILGHVGSERAGMLYITDLLREKAPDLEIKYFETPEVYTYTDSDM